MKRMVVRKRLGVIEGLSYGLWDYDNTLGCLRSMSRNMQGGHDALQMRSGLRGSEFRVLGAIGRGVILRYTCEALPTGRMLP